VLFSVIISDVVHRIKVELSKNNAIHTAGRVYSKQCRHAMHTAVCVYSPQCHTHTRPAALILQINFKAQKCKTKTNTNPSPDPNRYRRRCSDPNARIQKFIYYMVISTFAIAALCDSGLSPQL